MTLGTENGAILPKQFKYLLVQNNSVTLSKVKGSKVVMNPLAAQSSLTQSTSSVDPSVFKVGFGHSPQDA